MTCNKCGLELPQDSFYVRLETGKRRRTCRVCWLSASTARRNANIEAVRQYDRDRARAKNKTGASAAAREAWNLKNRSKRRAAWLLDKAIKSGKVERITWCQSCGASSVRLETHHSDYLRPLDVIWLCKPCHAFADKARRSRELPVAV
jgi:hypothetical protein